MREGQLYEYSVHPVVAVEAVYLAKQYALLHILWQFDEFAVKAAVLGRLNLPAHIRPRGGVIPHDNDLQARTPAVLCFEASHLFFHLIFQSLRNLFSVYNHNA